MFATNVTKSYYQLIELSHTGHSWNVLRRCRDFEATQLLNLMPGTADEARTQIELKDQTPSQHLVVPVFVRKLIPTLDGNRYLDDLVKEPMP